MKIIIIGATGQLGSELMRALSGSEAIGLSHDQCDVTDADTVVRTRGVHMLDELGVPEAFWEYEVDGFKGIVTMDSNGRSLHDDILERTRAKRDALLGLAPSS